MASIRKHGKKWRAEVARKGVRKSKLCASRQEARDWAARIESEILDGEGRGSRQALRDVLDRYGRDVSSKKRGYRWEVVRLELFKKDPVADIAMADLTPADFAAWRDRRAAKVAPGSVSREMNLMRAVMTVALDEWGLLSRHPMKGVRAPAEPPARERRPTKDEIKRIEHVAGSDLSQASARAVHAFRFAIETGMRAGEIAALRAGDVDLKRRVARIAMAKNGTGRDVPLSSAAVALIEALPEADPVFGLTAAQVSSLFARVRRRAGVEGLTFHDSRHEAITRLSRKLDVLALAKMVGHKNIRQLMTYYDATAEELAARLD